jgi:anaerobic magnesium-protoporphyrin IX monomethyl ester cyclase
MNILLIYPSYVSVYSSKTILPPLGLLSVASILEKNNHKVTLLDTNIHGLDFHNLSKKIKYFSPDLVGFSSTSLTIMETLEEIKVVKEVFPNVSIVVGGPHGTAWPEHILSSPYVDFVVRGEGELTFLELVEQLEKERAYEKILGLSYKRDGKIINNPPRPPIPNLDILPFPSYHLLEDIDLYWAPRSRKKPLLTCITSRGCTQACNFCSVWLSSGKAACWRAHSPEYVVGLFEHLIDTFHVRDLVIQDDSFTADMNRAERICDELIARGIHKKIVWQPFNGIRADRVSKSLLKKMKNAGCYHVAFGIESGNQDILNLAGKGETLESMRKAVTWSKEVGLETSGSFILGLLGDDEHTMRDTINFAKSLPLDQVSFNTMIPLVGSVFYKIVEKEGKFLVSPTDPRYYADEPVFELRQCTRELLLKMKRDAYREFYFRFSYIPRQLLHIRSFSDLSYYWSGLKLARAKTKMKT